MANACANCGKAIGQSAEPYVWQERVVCGPCYYRLSQPPTPVIADRSPPRPGQSRFKQKPWIALGVLALIVAYAIAYFIFGWGHPANPDRPGNAPPTQTIHGLGMPANNEKSP